MTALVPTVDLSRPSATSMEALDTACRDHGFFLLEGHGLDALIERTWSAAHRFFDAPAEVRQAIRRDADNPLGWYDRELTKRRRDRKEVFDFVDPSIDRSRNPNRWPEGLDDVRTTLETFFDEMADVAARTMALLHRVLLDGDTLHEDNTATAPAHDCDRRASSVRLNRYTVGDPVPAGERDDLRPLADVALGQHTDPGVITLLLQDDVGGLQTFSEVHGWIDVPPTPGTVVVNLGDTMQVWTNDRWRAALHRVVPTDRSRLSIPWFGNPPRDTVVQPIDALLDEPARYRPFTWQEFMSGRKEDNFADLGTDDIQITRYAVNRTQ